MDPIFNDEFSEERFRRYDNIIGEILIAAKELSISIEVKWHPKLKRAEITEFSVLLNGEELLKIDESEEARNHLYILSSHQ